jgi:hypothetical protein
MKTSRFSNRPLIAVALVLGLGLLLTFAARLSGGLVSAAAGSAPSAVNLPPPDSNLSATPAAKANRQLTLKERVAYQRAIEAVYWRHRIWPEANRRPKPALEAVMPLAQIQAKVEDSLRKSRALEAYRRQPITGAQLQAEIERMASRTAMPAMLAELWAALDNDPFVIAECLARPTLVERLMQEQPAANVAKSKRLSLNAVTETATGITYKLPAMSTPPPPATTDIGGAWTASNMWSAISTTNQPALRANNTAVWTGAEMIVWGGVTFSAAFAPDTVLDTGGKYNPATDSWTATSLTNAPSARWMHTAVWTGSEAIIWGGADVNGVPTDTGGKYNPTANSWTTTSAGGAPTARFLHTAVWTGSDMVVWGGFDFSIPLDTGGKYNPTGDSWTATNTTGAPSPRIGHTAVWTGSKMIVWGGITDTGLGSVSGGGTYDPTGGGSWTATSLTNEPSARAGHTAVWTGTEMIVWGGLDLTSIAPTDTGGRYSPTSDSWMVTSTTGAPEARFIHTAVWTGSAMVVWGGSNFPGPDALATGGSYSPTGDSWTATSTTGAPAGRGGHSAVWTGSKMLIWGSFGADFGVSSNTAPVVTITGPASGSVFAVGTPVNFTGTFTDDAGDTHTAEWMFDALTQTATVVEPSGSTPGSANATYTFTQAGVYAVKLTVTDNGTLSGTATTVGEFDALVVIYDPSAGWVTGGGWINSPAGAYVPNPSLTGKANFGFVSKYQNGNSVPTGNTEFHFKAGDLKFKSTSYEWMVISGGKKAQYKGFGTINGSGNYRFMLTAIDGQKPGGGGQDKFRIRIWSDGGGLVYDNQMNDPDSNDPTTVLGGGSIQIHN